MYLFACLQVVVHGLNGLEHNIVPQQIVKRAKDSHLIVESFRLHPLHPTMPQDSRERYATTGVQLKHVTNQLLAFYMNMNRQRNVKYTHTIPQTVQDIVPLPQQKMFKGKDEERDN